MAQAAMQVDNDVQTEMRLLTKHSVAAADIVVQFASGTDPATTQKLAADLKFERYAQAYVNSLYSDLTQQRGAIVAPSTIADLVKQAEKVATARVNLDEEKLTQAQFEQIQGNVRKAVLGPQVKRTQEPPK